MLRPGATFAGPNAWGGPLKSGKPTSRDIAHAAGVSQATVSRALRNSPEVTPETRARVMEVARELNYRVDKNAAGLRSRHSNTIALLLFEDSSTDESQINPFFLSMLGSIARAAAASDYDLLVSFQQLSNNWQGRYEASNRADGIILLGYGDYLNYGEKLRALDEGGAHYMIWGPTIEQHDGRSLGCDNVSGGRQSTEHLLSLGRKRIAFLGDNSPGFPEFRARYFGYEAALKTAGIEPDPSLQRDAENSENAGYIAVQSLVLGGADFDAIVTCSDLIAIGALRALQELGKHVPEDVSLVGFDDIPAASYVNPGLTTIRQDTLRAGAMLVDNLIGLIHERSVASALIEPRLVVRRSCGGHPR
ncbi:MAG: LacI family DNA-binding transcriptional regulator [Pseudomonadota bacterium]